MRKLTKQQRRMIKIKRLRRAGLSIKEIAQKMCTNTGDIIEQLQVASPEFMLYDSIMPNEKSIAEDQAIMDILNEVE